MPTDSLLDALLDVALDAAHGAAALLQDGFGQARSDVSTKSSPTDMVSEMDRAAEAHIGRILAERRPDDAVLGEEGTARPGRSGVRWVIDPLDGTTNYLFGVPAYAVSVAAEVDGSAGVGVVVDASRSETWAARQGGGATLNGQPIRLSVTSPPLPQALIATGFSYLVDQRTRQAHLLTHVLPEVRDIRRFGSAAIDLCWVAGGRVNGYYERGVQTWDVAAGSLIATEAGAQLTTLADGTVVCTGPGLLESLVALLESAPADLG